MEQPLAFATAAVLSQQGLFGSAGTRRSQMAASQGAGPASAQQEAKRHVREAGETLFRQDKSQRCQYMSKKKDMDVYLPCK